jgi:hypothetical protein
VYIADPRIPRKAAPMVFPSEASTMLNDEAGHETAGGGRGIGEKRGSNRTAGKPGYLYNFCGHMTKNNIRRIVNIGIIIECLQVPATAKSKHRWCCPESPGVLIDAYLLVAMQRMAA